MERGCDLESESLSIHERAELENILKLSEISGFVPSADSRARDAIRYRIRLTANDEDLDVTFDDTDMTEGLASLVQFLQNYATPY